jgi:hypothetical protein
VQFLNEKLASTRIMVKFSCRWGWERQGATEVSLTVRVEGML